MNFHLSNSTTDVLKFVSAILVVLHHFVCCMPDAWDFIPYRPIVFFAGSAGVSVFFFLSGFGIMESERNSHLDFRAFIRRRFLKIYLPVLLVTALWLGFGSIFVPGVLIPGEQHSFLYNLFINFGDPVFWFVQVLLWLYAGFYLFTLIYAHRPAVALIFLSAFTIIVAIVTYHWHVPVLSAPVPFFTIGVITSLVKDKKYGLWIMIDLLAIILAVDLPIYDIHTTLRIMFNLVLIATILVVFSVRRIDLRIPPLLAAVSFDIYLVHFKMLMMRTFDDSLRDIAIYTAALISCTLLIYYIRTSLLGPKTANLMSKMPVFWRKPNRNVKSC